MNKQIDVGTLTGMNDGSPKGNAYIGASFIDIAICTDKKCPALGLSLKCHSDHYVECLTYLRRNDTEAFGVDEDSELVCDMIGEDIFLE